MVDLSEVLKARIKGMSPEEIQAAELRRQAREVIEPEQLDLEATWENAAGEAEACVGRPITVRIEEGEAALQDALLVAQGSTFQERIALTPAVYRLLAGGRDDSSLSPADHFVIDPGKPGFDKVTTARAPLAARIARERPGEMARARRLLERERSKPATLRLPVDRRIALFVDGWTAEDVDLRVDAAVANVRSRAMLLMARRDQVALRVREGDLAEDGLQMLAPSLAAAVLKPHHLPRRIDPTIVGAATRRKPTFFQSVSHGSGCDRLLLLDLARFRKVLCGLPDEESRADGLNALHTIVARSQMLEDATSARIQRASDV